MNFSWIHKASQLILILVLGISFSAIARSDKQTKETDSFQVPVKILSPKDLPSEVRNIEYKKEYFIQIFPESETPEIIDANLETVKSNNLENTDSELAEEIVLKNNGGRNGFNTDK